MHTPNIFYNIKILTVLSLCLSSYACGGGDDDVTGSTNASGSVATSSSGSSTTTTSSGSSSSTTTSSASLTASCGEGSGNTIRVGWDQPISYTDNATLNYSDIAKYTVSYGTESGNYTTVIDINDPVITNCAIADLPSDTYFLTVTVTLIDGRESDYSNEVIRSI